MSFRALILVLFVPTFVSAQGTERYLPARSQIVLQIDSHAKTQAAFDRTAVGRMMQGETGKFLSSFYRWILENAEVASNEYDVPTKDDVVLIKDGIKLIEKGLGEGLALGIEITRVWPPDARLVVVLPKLGSGDNNAAKWLDRVKARVEKEGLPVQIANEKLAGRAVAVVATPFAQAGWWAEGDDFVLTLGVDSVESYVKAIEAGKTGVGNQPAYKKLVSLETFPTRSRAYVDMPSLVKLAADFSQAADKTVEEIGLKGLGTIYSLSGYDGPALRSISEFELAQPRKSLIGSYTDRKVSLASLPPLPSDLTSLTVSNANGGQVYGSLLDLVEKLVKIHAPDQADNIEGAIKGFEAIIGVDFRKDLFSCFDDLTIQYSAPSESMMGLASTSLFKLKDEARFKKGLAAVMQAVPQIPGVGGNIKKRNYRGVDLYELQTNSPGNFAVQSFAVHKGYFIYAAYPQPVQGFILRADGALPAWKADDRFNQALAAFPKEWTGMTYSDPRPRIESLLAAAPALIATINGFTTLIPGMTPFDVGIIPHAQEATRDLFPNVSISTDEGNRVRTETRRSIGW